MSIIIGAHARHISGIVGTVMGLWAYHGTPMATVCVDRCDGRNWAAYPVAEWEVI